MRAWSLAVGGIAVGLGVVGCAGTKPAQSTDVEESPQQVESVETMQLGNFSVSLTVKDIAASKAFYEKIGFKAVGGDIAQNWLIMQNETSTIGLFQGMFERNILTFNPGWDRNCRTLTTFEDVRDIQRRLRAQGIEPETAADELTEGPASLVIVDPDGNPILVDQHVPKPKK